MTPGLAVILIGGDAPHAPLVPEEVPHARRAIAWAIHVMIHATGAQDWHYETAAATRGRVLLIETCTRHRDAWMAEALRYAARVLLIDIPPDAPAHPLPESVH